jgi:hypothetical protein
MLDGIQHETPDCVALIDEKGDEWQLAPIGAQYDKRNGRQYYFWAVCEGPEFLHKNGAHYDVIWTEIFTEWWA